MMHGDVKKWTITVGGVGAVIGVLLSGMKLYQELGLPMIATQEHVEQKLAPVISNIQGMRNDVSGIALEQALQQRAQIENHIAQWTLELSRETTDERKTLDQAQINDLTDHLNQVKRHIDQLQRDAYGAH
jgi:hypothetical protein